MLTNFLFLFYLKKQETLNLLTKNLIILDTKQISKQFEEKFGQKPSIITRSPGRINIIGEHTDYNLGYVLPAAINRHIYFAFAPNNEDYYNLYAADYDQTVSCKKNDLHKFEEKWPDYVIGVIDQFQKKEKDVPGFNAFIHGDIPLGAGLSSSAALECATAFALNLKYRFGLDREDLALLCQKAEHVFAGVNCGIMDQFASVFGQKNLGILLDCRSMNFEYYPVELSQHNIILCDTKVKHALASTEYNQRRRECEEGVKILKKYGRHVESLRDVDLPMLEAVKDKMPQAIFNRCKYVIEENERVHKTSFHLKKNQMKEVGNLLYESHTGLSELYQVSCEELDYLVNLTKELNYVAGARMMGGGFGGCTINLVEKSKSQAFKKHMQSRYWEAYNKEPEIIDIELSTGTEIIK